MPRLTNRLPRLCEHKGTDRAIVYLDGRAVYCGKVGSAESRARYKQVVADWLAARDTKERPASASKPSGGCTITDLVLKFKRYTETHHAGSREPDNLRLAIRPVRAMFGKMLASDFGPSQLRPGPADAMVTSGLCPKDRQCPSEPRAAND